MTPKEMIIYAAVAIMTGSFLLSQLLNFTDWLKKLKKKKREEE